jgi:hypothetical protein
MYVSISSCLCVGVGVGVGVYVCLYVIGEYLKCVLGICERARNKK